MPKWRLTPMAYALTFGEVNSSPIWTETPGSCELEGEAVCTESTRVTGTPVEYLLNGRCRALPG